MIEDTGLRVQNIADSYFPNQTARSRFLEEMQNNMKKYSGIPLYMSNEELSEERNAQNEKDYYEGTEKSLVSGDMSNPVDYNNVISNIDAYAAMERSYPSTVVYAAFTDKEVAESMQTDDAFFINAANTDEDYPVWVTRTNIVNSALLEAMENDEASIFSQVKRVVVPTGLAIGFEAMKSVAGTFLASGLSAAYDTTRLGGQSIYNVQNKYKQRYMDIISNKNLNQEQTLEAARRMFEDLKAEVPEEYRYEIYKGIYERPDPFADFGQAFSGAALEAGWRTLKTSVRGSTGMLRGMKEYSKKSLNKVKHIGQPNQGIEELDKNDELIKKIEDHVNNKVSEETVDAVVEHKAAAKAPKTPEETTPEKEEVVKGIIKEKEIDNNLLLNNNGDHISYEPTGWPISYGKMLHDLGRSGSGLGKRLMTLGEINESGKSIGYVSVIEHGKGVDGNTPFTYEEAQQWLRSEQGRNQPVNYFDTQLGSLEYAPEKAPKSIIIETAGKTPWSTDPNIRGRFDYEGHHPGERSQAYGGGGYGAVGDLESSSAREGYFKKFGYNGYLNDSERNYKIKYNNQDVTSEEVFKILQDNTKTNETELARASLVFDSKKELFKEAWNLGGPSKEAYDYALKRLGTFLENRKRFGYEDLNDVIMELEAVSPFEAFRRQETNLVFIHPHQDANEYLQGHMSLKKLKTTLNDYEDAIAVDIKEIKKHYEKFLNEKGDISNEEVQNILKKYDDSVETGDIDKDFMDKYKLLYNHWWQMHADLDDLISHVYNYTTLDSDLKTLKDIKVEKLSKDEWGNLTSLNTHLIPNPEYNLDNHIWWDEKHGIIPLADFYKGDKALEISKRTMQKIYNINKEIADGIYEYLQKDDNKYAAIEMIDKYTDDEKSFMTFLKSDSRSDIQAKMDTGFEDLNRNASDSLGVWEDFIRRFIYNPLPESEKAKYYDFKDWHSKYLTSKGIDITWHHGFANSPGINVVVHNTNLFKPVTKVETFIHNPEKHTQYLHDNGHGIYTEDGINWKGLEVHAPDDAKPVIIEAGKIVDKP